MSGNEIDAMALEADRPFRRREFAGHAFLYVVVNAFLFALWGAGVGAGLWPVWVLAGWGVLLGLDAWRAFPRSDVKERGPKARALRVGRPAASAR